LSRRDNAADGMNGEFLNNASGRRTDNRTLREIFSSRFALDQFPFFRLGLVDIVQNLRAEGLAGLDALQASFVDLVAGLGNLRRKLTVEALKPGRLTLKRGQALHCHELLFEQLLDVRELLRGDGHLRTVRGKLRFKPKNLLFELLDAAAGKVLLATAVARPRSQDGFFRGRQAAAFSSAEFC